MLKQVYYKNCGCEYWQLCNVDIINASLYLAAAEAACFVPQFPGLTSECWDDQTSMCLAGSSQTPEKGLRYATADKLSMPPSINGVSISTSSLPTSLAMFIAVSA